MVLVLQVMDIPAGTAALVEVEAVVLDWVVQMAADLEAALAEVLEAQEDLVAAAVMTPVGASVEQAQEVLVVAP